MNSVIEAQQEFLEFCPWNWKSDRFIRVITYRKPSLHGIGEIDHVRGKRIDDQNAIWNRIDKQKRELELLDKQRL